MGEPDEGSYAWMLRFHLGERTVRGTGVLTVRRGPGPPARLACALLGLPRTGTAVPLHVTVTRLTAARTAPAQPHRPERTAPGPLERPVPDAEAGRREVPVVERWERVIGGRRLLSHQIRLGERGWERHGPLEVRTRTVAGAADVEVVQLGVVLRAGRHEIPVPARLAPRVHARAWTGPEDPDGGPPSFRLEVEVALPMIGRLLSYQGHCREERA
ncbi:DUF4166 domain-containing protein [Sphaerisporangium sp. NPDC004334]